MSKYNIDEDSLFVTDLKIKKYNSKNNSKNNSKHNSKQNSK